MISAHYTVCCVTPGPVNPAGDTLQSIADSHRLSEVIKYLHSMSLSADVAGESSVDPHVTVYDVISTA